MNRNMLTKSELLAFAHLKKMSRAMKTIDDARALKAAVVNWVRDGPTPTARMRRRDWSRSIKGAYADLDPDTDPYRTSRVIWGYNEGD